MAKGKYHEWITEEGLLKLQGLARDGYTDQMIADAIGISTSTLYNWSSRFQKLEEILVCKGQEGISYKNTYAIGSKKPKREYYKDGERVMWCKICGRFVLEKDYIINGHKCRECGKYLSHIYRDSEQGKETKKKYASKYYKENKDKVYTLVYKRINRVKENDYDYNTEKWEDVLEYFDHRCAYCGAKVSLEREHIIPVTKGGGYISKNIIPACRKCNMRKLDKDMEEWYKGYEKFEQSKLDKIHEWVAGC